MRQESISLSPPPFGRLKTQPPESLPHCPLSSLPALERSERAERKGKGVSRPVTMLGSPGQQPGGAGSGATAGAAAGSAATAAGGTGGVASFPCGGASERLLARYVQDYLECVESLPLDMQRLASLLREMDTRCRGEQERRERDGETGVEPMTGAGN